MLLFTTDASILFVLRNVNFLPYHGGRRSKLKVRLENTTSPGCAYGGQKRAVEYFAAVSNKEVTRYNSRKGTAAMMRLEQQQRSE